MKKLITRTALILSLLASAGYSQNVDIKNIIDNFAPVDKQAIVLDGKTTDDIQRQVRPALNSFFKKSNGQLLTADENKELMRRFGNLIAYKIGSMSEHDNDTLYVSVGTDDNFYVSKARASVGDKVETAYLIDEIRHPEKYIKENKEGTAVQRDPLDTNMVFDLSKIPQKTKDKIISTFERVLNDSYDKRDLKRQLAADIIIRGIQEGRINALGVYRTVDSTCQRKSGDADKKYSGEGSIDDKFDLILVSDEYGTFANTAKTYITYWMNKNTKREGFSKEVANKHLSHPSEDKFARYAVEDPILYLKSLSVENSLIPEPKKDEKKSFR